MELNSVLSDIGHDIARRGIDQVPEVEVLADAIRATSPVLAGILLSVSDPEVVRARAFQRTANVMTTLSTTEQVDLVAALLERQKPVVPIRERLAVCPERAAVLVAAG